MYYKMQCLKVMTCNYNFSQVFYINALCVVFYSNFAGVCCSPRNECRRIFFLICSLYLGPVICKLYSKYCLEENKGNIHKILIHMLITISWYCIFLYTVFIMQEMWIHSLCLQHGPQISIPYFYLPYGQLLKF